MTTRKRTRNRKKSPNKGHEEAQALKNAKINVQNPVLGQIQAAIDLYYEERRGYRGPE